MAAVSVKRSSHANYILILCTTVKYFTFDITWVQATLKTFNLSFILLLDRLNFSFFSILWQRYIKFLAFPMPRLFKGGVYWQVICKYFVKTKLDFVKKAPMSFFFFFFCWGRITIFWMVSDCKVTPTFRIILELRQHSFDYFCLHMRCLIE